MPRDPHSATHLNPPQSTVWIHCIPDPSFQTLHSSPRHPTYRLARCRHCRIHSEEGLRSRASTRVDKVETSTMRRDSPTCLVQNPFHSSIHSPHPRWIRESSMQAFPTTLHSTLRSSQQQPNNLSTPCLNLKWALPRTPDRLLSLNPNLT